MKFSALRNISAVTAVLVASSAFASMTTLTASNITGTGFYEQAPTTWSIQFTFDGALTQTSLNGDFGNWTLAVAASDGTSWSQSGSGKDVLSFTNITNGKIFNLILGDGVGGIQGTYPINPVPSVLSLTYTTTQTAGVYMTLGQAIDYSVLNTTPAEQRGRLTVTPFNGGGAAVDGEISGFFVPAPGSFALMGLAGMVPSRRRRN